MGLDSPIAVKKEVFQMNEGIRCGELSSSSAKVDGLCSLSGDKPYFDIILSRSHVFTPHCLNVPAHIVSILPRATVPVVLTHGGKKWHVSYNGKLKRPRFEYSEWKKFVVDNNLKCEDACIFEVMELTSEILRLRVVILRNTKDLPPELHVGVESDGTTPETAIEID